MKGFRLRSPSQAEVDQELTPFELELTAVFRAVSVAAVDALRRAARDGLSPDAAIDRAGSAVYGRLHADTEEAQGRVRR